MDNKEASLTQQLQELKDFYKQELPGKLAEISHLWQILTVNWSTEALSNLLDCLHRISGSAGSFGYHDLGTKAAKVQQLLKHYNENK